MDDLSGPLGLSEGKWYHRINDRQRDLGPLQRKAMLGRHVIVASHQHSIRVVSRNRFQQCVVQNRQLHVISAEGVTAAVPQLRGETLVETLVDDQKTRHAVACYAAA